MQQITEILSVLDHNLFFFMSPIIFFIFGPKLADPSFFFDFSELNMVSKSSTTTIEGWNYFAQIMTDQMSFTSSAFSEYLSLTHSGVKS